MISRRISPPLSLKGYTPTDQRNIDSNSTFRLFYIIRLIFYLFHYFHIISLNFAVLPIYLSIYLSVQFAFIYFCLSLTQSFLLFHFLCLVLYNSCYHSYPHTISVSKFTHFLLISRFVSVIKTHFRTDLYRL